MENHINDDQGQGVQQMPYHPQRKEKFLMFLLGMIFMLGLMYITNGNLLSMFGQKWYQTSEFKIALADSTQAMDMYRAEIQTLNTRAKAEEELRKAVAVAYFLKGYSKTHPSKKADIKSFTTAVKDDIYLMQSILSYGPKYLDANVVEAVYTEYMNAKPTTNVKVDPPQ